VGWRPPTDQFFFFSPRGKARSGLHFKLMRFFAVSYKLNFRFSVRQYNIILYYCHVTLKILCWIDTKYKINTGEEREVYNKYVGIIKFKNVHYIIVFIRVKWNTYFVYRENIKIELYLIKFANVQFKNRLEHWKKTSKLLALYELNLHIINHKL